jgi:hypothetical protein
VRHPEGIAEVGRLSRRQSIGIAFVLAALVLTGPSAWAATSGDERTALQTYRDVAATAAKHGWACVYVAGGRGERNLAYSVGLSGKHQPEVLLTSGDDYAAACTMINVVAKALLARRDPIHDGDAPVAKMASDVRLRSIYPDEFYERCPLAAMWRDAHKIKDAAGMQIVFADKDGRFPD